MSIEKSLYEAPQGISSLSDEEPIEIEIVDPEEVHIAGPGFEIDIEKGEPDFDANLAEEISEQDMESIVSEIVSDYDDDVASRRDWIKAYVDGLELLGLKIEERTDPWPGACGVYHPLLSEALVKFQAETIMEIFPATGPARIEIVGLETPAKKEAAMRVQQDMNYMLTDTMTEYRSETERMLWGLGLSGNAFKKIYYDPHTERPAAIFCPAEDVVVPYGASNIETSPRVTHVMRKTENELRRLQVMGFYRDIELGEPNNTMDEVEKKIADKMGFKATSDFRYKLLEMQVDLDLPGYEHKDKDGEPTGIALPYLVTIEHGSNQVLSIRRNWEEGDKTYQKRQHFVHYGYVPGFGFYYFGLIHLIGAFAKSGTSLIRQLVDAGTLANLPGGFKTRGLRVKGDDTPIAPAEFRDVDVPSGAIKDNLMLLPYKEPSQVLMSLLNQIVEDGRRFANTADLATADLNANAPVGTTLAILERTMKVMTAVQARVHYSLKQELRLLKKIIAAYTPHDYDYDPQEGSRAAKRSDYNNVDVIPVSDPNASTMSQKVVQWSAVMQLAQGSPQLYDMAYLHRQMIETLGIQNAAKLIPMAEDQKAVDPITENMDALNSNPLKAFIYQDHQAHITAHQSFLTDPSVAQTIAQNPQMNQIVAALQAHIAEHLGFLYRSQIEQQMGVTMPEPGKELPPETEMQLSKLIAEASLQLKTIHTNEAAQKQIAQQQQDPLIQIQQQELQLKAQAQQAKTAKDQADIQARMAQIQIERERIQSQAQIEQARLAVQQQKNQTQAETDMAREKLRLGVQAAIRDAEIKHKQ
jgi:hypothetical protein